MSRFVGKELKTIFLDTENYSQKSLEELKEIVKGQDLGLRGDENKEELVKILDDQKEWVKIPKALSFNDVSKITGETDTAEMSKKMLFTCIKEWNLKDDEGKIPEITEENILILDIETITILTQEITKMITPEIKEVNKKK